MYTVINLHSSAF